MWLNRSTTASRAASVCAVRSPKFWLGLLSTMTTATELNGSRCSRVSDGLASASTTSASASVRIAAPRLREMKSSEENRHAAAIAAHNSAALMRGANATPRFNTLSYCPNRSSNAGTCT